MRLLLDTHALLWSMTDDPRLGAKARALISDPANLVLVSMACLWEIAIKVRLGKLEADLDEIDSAIDAQGFDRLDIALPHLQALATLPTHHRDPFDHLLIAQAQSEQLTFVTNDRHASLYPIAVVRCAQ